jgi:hypothetical protein
MSGDYEKPEVDVHPFILYHEKTGATTVRVTGYIGSRRSGWVRIYADLSGQSYLEISEEDVVSVLPDKNQFGRVELFVASNAKLARTTTSRVTAAASWGAPSVGLSNPPLSIPEPMSRCEAESAAAIGEANKWLGMSQSNPNSLYGMRAYELGNAMAVVARKRLQDCIDTALAGQDQFDRIWDKHKPLVLPLHCPQWPPFPPL